MGSRSRSCKRWLVLGLTILAGCRDPEVRDGAPPPLDDPAESTGDVTDEELRAWLTATVPVQDGPTSRLERYHRLHEVYLAARDAWKFERDSWITAAAGDAEALEQVAARIAKEAPGREAEIASLWDQLVVEGEYHKVRAALTALGLEELGE